MVHNLPFDFMCWFYVELLRHYGAVLSIFWNSFTVAWNPVLGVINMFLKSESLVIIGTKNLLTDCWQYFRLLINQWLCQFPSVHSNVKLKKHYSKKFYFNKYCFLWITASETNLINKQERFFWSILTLHFSCIKFRIHGLMSVAH